MRGKYNSKSKMVGFRIGDPELFEYLNKIRGKRPWSAFIVDMLIVQAGKESLTKITEQLELLSAGQAGSQQIPKPVLETLIKTSLRTEALLKILAASTQPTAVQQANQIADKQYEALMAELSTPLSDADH